MCGKMKCHDETLLKFRQVTLGPFTASVAEMNVPTSGISKWTDIEMLWSMEKLE